MLRFAKGHGTGNDFVILPDLTGSLPLTPRLVAALCDRRRGIGADGVLRVVRAQDHPAGRAHAPAATWFMDYWNADGSIAEMCGNGVRVYARYLCANGLVEPGELDIATRAGVVTARVGPDEISARLRRPRPYGESVTLLAGRRYQGTAVDVGNPHLVCALDGGTAELSGLDLGVSPEVSEGQFPTGANVEFFVPGRDLPDRDLHVRMRVFERGSGETLSCGSGACAVAAVALARAGRATGRVAVDVPGGRLTVTVEDDCCWLTGPAVVVATGELDPATLDVALPGPTGTA